MNPSILLRCLSVLWLGTLLPAAAETTAVVRLMDGRTHTLEVESLRFETLHGGGITGRTGGRSIRFSAQDVLRIELSHEPVARGSTEQIWLCGGTRLSGRFVGWGSTTLNRSGSIGPVVQSDLFRTLRLKENALAGVTTGYPPPPRLPPAAAGKDLLWTIDGDRFMGRMVRADSDNIVFRSELGSLNCPRHRMKALVTAREKRDPPADATWLLDWANGDRVWTDAWNVDAKGDLRCAFAGSESATKAALLRRAVRVGQGVTIFSRIQPKAFNMEPVLEGTRGIIVDHGLEDFPLCVGQREYAFGLFLRPDCEMEYDLGGDDALFLAELGISSSTARAGAARVAMSVGDAPWKTFSLSARAAPQTVALALRDARRLRMRVEAANAWGSGAHVVLGEPVLIRKRQE